MTRSGARHTGDGFHKLRSGIGVEAVVAVSQGSNNKPSDELRILHCQLERDTCSHAVTEEVRMVNLSFRTSVAVSSAIWV